VWEQNPFLVADVLTEAIAQRVQIVELSDWRACQLGCPAADVDMLHEHAHDCLMRRGDPLCNCRQQYFLLGVEVPLALAFPEGVEGCLSRRRGVRGCAP